MRRLPATITSQYPIIASKPSLVGSLFSLYLVLMISKSRSIQVTKQYHRDANPWILATLLSPAFWLCLSAASATLTTNLLSISFVFSFRALPQSKLATNRTIFPLQEGLISCGSPSVVGLFPANIRKMEMSAWAINTSSSHRGAMSCWTEKFYLMKRKKHQKDLFRSTYLWPSFRNRSAILGDRVSLRYHGGTKRSVMHMSSYSKSPDSIVNWPIAVASHQ